MPRPEAEPPYIEPWSRETCERVHAGPGHPCHPDYHLHYSSNGEMWQYVDPSRRPDYAVVSPESVEVRTATIASIALQEVSLQ